MSLLVTTPTEIYNVGDSEETRIKKIDKFLHTCIYDFICVNDIDIKRLKYIKKNKNCKVYHAYRHIKLSKNVGDNTDITNKIVEAAIITKHDIIYHKYYNRILDENAYAVLIVVKCNGTQVNLLLINLYIPHWIVNSVRAKILKYVYKLTNDVVYPVDGTIICGDFAGNMRNVILYKGWYKLQCYGTSRSPSIHIKPDQDNLSVLYTGNIKLAYGNISDISKDYPPSCPVITCTIIYHERTKKKKSLLESKVEYIEKTPISRGNSDIIYRNRGMSYIANSDQILINTQSDISWTSNLDNLRLSRTSSNIYDNNVICVSSGSDSSCSMSSPYLNSETGSGPNTHRNTNSSNRITLSRVSAMSSSTSIDKLNIINNGINLNEFYTSPVIQIPDINEDIRLGRRVSIVELVPVEFDANRDSKFISDISCKPRLNKRKSSIMREGRSLMLSEVSAIKHNDNDNIDNTDDKITPRNRVHRMNRVCSDSSLRNRRIISKT